MGRGGTQILRVALPVPLRRCFDYLAPPGETGVEPRIGCRVRVHFGRRKYLVGMVVDTAAHSDIAAEKLKTIADFIDEKPLIDTGLLRLLRRASDYYQHPLGEVIFNALPPRFRAGKPARQETERLCRLRDTAFDPASLAKNARKQALLLHLLATFPGGLSVRKLLEEHEIQAQTIRTLCRKGLVEILDAPTAPLPARAASEPMQLNERQESLVKCVTGRMDSFCTYVIDGVTGSGKTEVYLSIVETVLAAGRQALVLLPEIGLTPQFVDRVGRRIGSALVVLHSGLGDTERSNAWLAARDGRAQVVLGTRSAVWTPMPKLGLIVVDEEHDQSYKQQDGFRYSARDMAVTRAQAENVPVVLGSATPSLESLRNIEVGRYRELNLSSRVGEATAPEMRIIDLRGRAMDGALSRPLIEAISEQLAAGRQSLLFLNRRGYAPAMICHACGWVCTCDRCSAPLTFHRRLGRLVCHHCDARRAMPGKCEACDAADIRQVGHGTERLEETLQTVFPEARILRIDRDSTRRRGAMDFMISAVNSGEADILLGTQMLAKGHHFPDVTLVGIIDADRGLYSTDFRAGERLAQLLVQVSGRAGRGEHPGKVLIQTHHPDHPMLRSLLEHGYRQFANLALQERRDAQLPPYTYLALLRAEHANSEPPLKFLHDAKSLLQDVSSDLQVLGPVPSPMERKAGRMRFHLLVQCRHRGTLATFLKPWSKELEGLASSGKVRWSLDVDPQDMI